ncbi:MAG: site-2 protease family protein [Deltaproteobacteria bacterium]|nr:site-2 protease family protein [Deltaproteobacteria bacterium]MBW2123460.1 site-2 protease family protein [Deltaproteobacteria bacterium]
MRRLLLHVLLFALTVGSTVLVGGVWYCISIMTILLAHELGHFLMSRHYRVQSSLPFFIPFPNLFGTLGAVIVMRGRIVSRKALFDIGAAGPLVGFCLTVPAIAVGLKFSHISQTVHVEGLSFRLGDSLLFLFLEKAIVGEIPMGADLVLHPLAYAGWVGLFVTALNLMPIGQLDGGHIAYAVFGRKSRIVFTLAAAGFGVLGLFFFPPWLFPLALIMLFGFRHPPPQDDETELDRGRKILAGVTVAVFAVSFIPVPLPEFGMNLLTLIRNTLSGSG